MHKAVPKPDRIVAEYYTKSNKTLLGRSKCRQKLLQIATTVKKCVKNGQPRHREEI
jgi:hypothetical protein